MELGHQSPDNIFSMHTSCTKWCISHSGSNANFQLLPTKIKMDNLLREVIFFSCLVVCRLYRTTYIWICDRSPGECPCATVLQPLHRQTTRLRESWKILWCIQEGIQQEAQGLQQSHVRMFYYFSSARLIISKRQFDNNDWIMNVFSLISFTLKFRITSDTYFFFCLFSDYRHSRTGRIREMVWE